MSSERRILAEFTDYPGMLAAIRARVDELSVNGERFDEFAGLPRGYLSKLIGANPIRRISMISMGPLFGALGIYCVMYEDANATARLRRRLRPRNNSYSRRSDATSLVFTRRFMQKIGRKGAHQRWQKLSKQQRSEIMRAVRSGMKYR
jgi:hypothetical protein